MASSERALHGFLVVVLALAMTFCGATDGPNASRDGGQPGMAAQAGADETTFASAVRLVSPSDGEVFSATAGPVEFVAEVTIPHAEVVAVRFLSDGGEIVKVTTPPYRVMYSPSQLGEGSHLLRAVAMTNRGDLESMPATIKVQPPVDEEVTAEDLSVMTVGPNNVGVRIYVPKAEQRYRAPADIEIRPAVLSTAGDIKYVEILADGQLLATRERSPHDYTWRDAPKGTHTITVRALTSTGRTADATVTVHVQ